jgi:hypothetical protein
LDRLKYDLTASAEVLEALTPGFVAERLPRRADGASAPMRAGSAFQQAPEFVIVRPALLKRRKEMFLEWADAAPFRL